MRAIWLHEFGGPDVLRIGDAPDPVAGPGQVVVDVAHANITFVETQFRATGAGPFKPELPMIPGNGVGGVVAAVGDGADPALLGTRVIASTGGAGGYAERVAVDAAGAIAVPDGLALDAAVALLADGRTATLLCRAAAPAAGERVLVEAAGGGVGSLLVQLAKATGAFVVAAAGGPRKLGLARALGADECVDYTEDGWVSRAGAVDVVFDGVGGDVGRAAFTLLRGGGRMVSFGLASGSWAGIEEPEAAARGVTLIGLTRPTPEVAREATEWVLAEAVAGRLRPAICQRFPLERAADAHTAIAARDTVGKTLLDVT
jgi:NADPH2:quinone reductase